MDVHNPSIRSFNMSRIGGKDTQPEIMVRKWLWENGFRYRLHRKDLPGKPDIVLPAYNSVVFVHGCFWHRHGCWMTTTPQSRRRFWLAKFQENINRDKRNIDALQNEGWRVMVIWECTLRNKTANPDLVFKQVSNFLKSETHFAESATVQCNSVECTV